MSWFLVVLVEEEGRLASGAGAWEERKACTKGAQRGGNNKQKDKLTVVHVAAAPALVAVVVAAVHARARVGDLHDDARLGVVAVVAALERRAVAVLEVERAALDLLALAARAAEVVVGVGHGGDVPACAALVAQVAVAAAAAVDRPRVGAV